MRNDINSNRIGAMLLGIFRAQRFCRALGIFAAFIASVSARVAPSTMAKYPLETHVRRVEKAPLERRLDIEQPGQPATQRHCRQARPPHSARIHQLSCMKGRTVRSRPQRKPAIGPPRLGSFHTHVSLPLRPSHVRHSWIWQRFKKHSHQVTPPLALAMTGSGEYSPIRL